MEWHIELAKLESQKDWLNALDLLEKVIAEKPSNVEVYIYVIYLLNDVALEERELKLPLTFDHLVDLVKKYYYKSSSIFLDNAQYCFYIGSYYDVLDWCLSSSIEESLNIPKKFLKKAHDLEPNNLLYNFFYLFYHYPNDDHSDLLNKILNDKDLINELKSKGFPGEHVIDFLQYIKKQNEFLTAGRPLS